MKNIFSFGIIGSILVLSCTKGEPVINNKPIITPDPVVVVDKKNDEKPKPCPDDMVFVDHFNFCIDRYEAPNQKDTKPFTAQTAFDAIKYCKSIGKDLCTQVQWQTACTGPKMKMYPYGNTYKKGTCNDDKTGWVPVPWSTMGTPTWDTFCRKQYKGEPSGSRSDCVSDYGVYDMTGNVAEWVKEPKNPHGYVVKGGYWYGVLQGTPSCYFVNPAHAPSFNSYEFGFRCCKDAQDSNQSQ